MFSLQLLLGVVVMVAIAVLVATAKGDPRTGLMSRFRLDFADGSSAAVLTPNPSTAGLQRHLAPAA